jgi:hypothetical protein
VQAQPKLLKEQWRAILLCGGGLGPRLSEKMVILHLYFPVKMLIEMWPLPSALAASHCVFLICGLFKIEHKDFSQWISTTNPYIVVINRSSSTNSPGGEP